MCRYAQNNRSRNTGYMIVRRVFETFVPHEPEEFLKRLASTNTTATSFGGCTAPKEGSKRDSTSKAFCRKRRRGLKQVLLFAMVIRIGLAAEEQSVLMLPLTPSGFQYTVGVTVSGTNYNATAALILDTALPLVGFPLCEDSISNSEDGSDCIPRAIPADISNFSCKISTIVRDNGEIIMRSTHSNSDSQGTTSVTFLEDQAVKLVNSTSTKPLRADGSVFVFSDKDIDDGYQLSTLQGWNSSGGVFGVAPYSTPCEESLESVFKVILRNLPAASSLVFALNLSDSTSESTLQIGGHNASLDDLLWGEKHTAQYPSYWGFTAFDLSICGRGLMNNVTSSWPAIISTGSACLGLPQEMYDSLVAWLPSCSDDPLEVCDGSIDSLPWLSFRLKEHGKPLYIPMGSLLLEDKRLCLTRGESIYKDSSFNMPLMQPFITLGTLPLRSLYAVLDAERNMVGLTQKPYGGELTPTERNETCQAAKSCQGMQTFKESENSCEDPLCSAYYFTWLDEDTMTCRPSKNLIIVAWSVGIILGVTEIIGHFLSVYYGGKGVALRGQRHHHGWEFYTGRVIDACISKATRAIGLSSRRHHD